MGASAGDGSVGATAGQSDRSKAATSAAARAQAAAAPKTDGDLLERRMGMTGTPTWKSWRAMVQRCTDTGHKHFDRYGGRGIAVCEKWMEFSGFYEDMGDRPAGMSIERADGNRGYEPGNCVWATPVEQNANRPTYVRMLTVNGEIAHLAEWARRANMSASALDRRLRAGWDPVRAVTEPLDRRFTRQAK